MHYYCRYPTSNISQDSYIWFATKIIKIDWLLLTKEWWCSQACEFMQTWHIYSAVQHICLRNYFIICKRSRKQRKWYKHYQNMPPWPKIFTYLCQFVMLVVVILSVFLMVMEHVWSTMKNLYHQKLYNFKYKAFYDCKTFDYDDLHYFDCLSTKENCFNEHELVFLIAYHLMYRHKRILKLLNKFLNIAHHVHWPTIT